MSGVIYIFFRRLLKVLDVILNIFEDSMCYLGVIEVYIFIPQSLIHWSSQNCYTYHQFDLVYFLCIPQRYQYIFSGGVTLELLLTKRRNKIMSTESLARREELYIPSRDNSF